MAGTDVVPFNPSDYPVLAEDGQSAELMEVLQENLGEDGGFGAFDLDRIKIPAGGGIAWEVPTISGPESQREIEGVVALWQQPRSYWERSLDEAGDDGTTPPDCASEDSRTGYGMYGVGSDLHPSGACADCPMNQWESAPKGGGKACSEQRLLFLLQPNNVLPAVVQLPPTSVRHWKKYSMRLSSAGLPYYGIVTKLGLTQEKNTGGIKYSEVALTAGEVLTPEVRARAKAYGANLRAMLNQVVRAAAEKTGNAAPPAPPASPEDEAWGASTGEPVDATA